MSSSVQNSVQQQQVQRTTVFPAFNNADNYATRILQVKNQYEKRYSVFWQANQKIEVLLKEWDTWQKEMMNSQQVTDEMREEYWRKIDIYVDCQTLRNEMRKLLIDYDDLFAHIREPADGLDLASLEILQKLGMNQELIKERYDE